MKIKPYSFNPNDYIAIAKLHVKFINQGFLSTLGIPFLSLLYEAIDKDSGSILLIIKNDLNIIGFVSGTSNLKKVYQQLLLQPLRLFCSLKSCFFSPSKIYKIIEILLIIRNNSSSVDLPKQELLSIVVDSKCQGKRYAETLFKDLCGYFKEKGASSFIIVVGSDLSRASAFYTKMGAVPVKEIQVHKGGSSMVFKKNLK